MEVSFISVLITVFTLVVVAVPGFILGKMKMFNDGAKKTLSTFLLFICQPFLTFMSFQKAGYSSDIGINMLIVAGTTALAHIILIAIIEISCRKKATDQKIRVLRYASIFGNCGFMGIPFLQTLFGSSGEILIYGAVVIAIFNLFAWTIGIYQITGDKKFISLKKAIFNPATSALIIGLIVFFSLKVPIKDIAIEGSTLDNFLEKMVISGNLLADMVTPLGMAILGLNLADMRFKEIFLNPRAYLGAFVKLVFMPFVVILIFLVFKEVDVLVKYTVFFTLSMPAATNTIMFAEQYGGDGREASSSVLLSTLLSVLTISLMFLVFKAMLGI
ncbi:MAG: hypothetical protein E7342_02240 [Clostridiales bacterium]|nr:hypothetical protein [Clostridiales bacterium]